MASALRQPLLTLTSKVLQISPKIAINPLLKAVTAPQIATRVTLSRNIWCATSKNVGFGTSSHINRHNRLCGCCSLHTEGDEKLTSFLEKEIKDEQRTVESITAIEGWDIKTDGTGVILTKQTNNETIKVEFDVNDTVDSSEPVFEGTDPVDVPALVSKPPFEVDIQKQSGRRLRFFCEFAVNEAQFEGEEIDREENVEDQFNIVEVQLGDNKDSGDIETYYTHSASVMDGTLYDMLMDMLDERGIDDDFVNNLVGFATSYEYKLYLKFLDDLKTIISEK